MKLQLRVLGGARAGVEGVFAHPSVTLGRHPACELQFDPERDLDVSGRHAAIERRGTRWIVRDLGSKNGTLVNGHPIHGDTTLDDTDQIRLGPAGPVVEVRLVSDGTPDRTPARAPATRSTPPRATGSTPVPRPRASSTAQRVRVAVVRQTRRLRTVTAVLVVLLIAGAAYVVVDRRQQAERLARERRALQAQVDSILDASAAALAQLQGRVDGLADALRRSQDDVQALQQNLRAAEAAGRSAEVERLRRELTAATQALSLQQTAATVNYRAIHDANHRAVAMLWTEFTDGEVVSGTAFAVTPGGILITNRHNVRGENGDRRPRRLAIQFTESPQVWRGRVVATDPDADLAAIQVEGIAGRVPTVAIPAPAPAPRGGDPVATIGFPFGTALPMRSAGEQNLVRATLTAGTVSKALPDLLQIDGYGAQGASGSPVFDAEGRLVGVLYGGEGSSGGRIVYAVPVNYVTALLGRLPPSSSR